MKQWQETGEIFGRLAELTESGQHAAVACVVHISGSAYRRPGARFLIAPDGSTTGGISGGCLEEDVRRAGLTAIEDGNCRLLHYETGKDDDPLWGLGLGCDGEVDVFVAPTSRPGLHDAFARARELFAGDEPFSMVTIIGDGGPEGAGLEGAGLEGRLFVNGPTGGGGGGGPTGGGAGVRDTDNNQPDRDRGVDQPGGDDVDPQGDQPGGDRDAGGNQSGGSGDHGDVETTDGDLKEALAAAYAALAGSRSRIIEIGSVRAFVEGFQPPPHLVVCGAGDDAMPMVASAASVGFRVVVVDHRPAYLTPERFPAARKLVAALPEDDAPGIPTDPDTFVVLKTHNLLRDKAWARRFMSTPVPYLGLLGPRARCEEIAEEVAGEAVAEGGQEADAEARREAPGEERTEAAGDAGRAIRSRIFGPVGLDLGAEGPEQVGMAVVAELLAVRAGRQPGHLKDREAPIHEPEP